MELDIDLEALKKKIRANEKERQTLNRLLKTYKKRNNG